MNNGQRVAHAGLTSMAAKRRSGWTRVAEEQIGDSGDGAEPETQPQSWSATSAHCCDPRTVGQDHSVRTAGNPAAVHLRRLDGGAKREGQDG